MSHLIQIAKGVLIFFGLLILIKNFTITVYLQSENNGLRIEHCSPNRESIDVKIHTPDRLDIKHSSDRYGFTVNH